MKSQFTAKPGEQQNLIKDLARNDPSMNYVIKERMMQNLFSQFVKQIHHL